MRRLIHGHGQKRQSRGGPTPRPTASSRRGPAALGAALALAFESSLQAAPVVHEFIEGAGATSAALRAPSREGAGAAGPAEEAEASLLGSARGAAPTPSRESFSIDADTAEPDTVPYADPFTPHVTPFKRARAFDSINANGTLRVAQSQATPVDRGLPRPGDESFHVSLSLQLRAGQAQPLPTPGPGARVVHQRSDPPTPLELSRDSADNWSVRAPRDVDTELTLQLSISRRAFGGRWVSASWQELAPHRPPVPRPVRQAAEQVARALGISAQHTPTQAVARLVEHFRAFLPAEEGAAGEGLALYRQLALGGRGVCRHRAYAFAVTAMGIGIPVRYVDNEAHAWVEVFTGDHWQRLDLGGAARQLDTLQDGRPEHVPPPDPLAWPENSQPGRSLSRSHTSHGGRAPGGPSGPAVPSAEEDPATPPSPSSLSSSLPQRPEPALHKPSRATAPPSPSHRVTLRLQTTTTTRGDSVLFEGSVLKSGLPCAGVSVDVGLTDASATEYVLGRLSSDEQGRFSGPLVVPPSAATGDHSVWGRVSPDQSCAARRLR